MEEELKQFWLGREIEKRRFSGERVKDCEREIWCGYVRVSVRERKREQGR